jgi:outer membrane usher protein
MPPLQSQANRIAIVLWVSAITTLGYAQEVPSTGSLIPLNVEVETQGPRDLYLEVFINGTSMKMIGNFKELPDGSLAATPEELTEVGLKPVETARTEDGLVRLDRLPDVSYKVDEAAQRLDVATDNEGRAARVINVGAAETEDRIKPQSGYGAVLNYSLFASSNTFFKDETDLFQGISGGFDGRFFSPYGTLSQSFIAGY